MPGTTNKRRADAGQQPTAKPLHPRPDSFPLRELILTSLMRVPHGHVFFCNTVALKSAKDLLSMFLRLRNTYDMMFHTLLLKEREYMSLLYTLVARITSQILSPPKHAFVDIL
jgi:hypothetical protein